MSVVLEALKAGALALSTLAGAADPKDGETPCDAFDASARQVNELNVALNQMGEARVEVENIVKEATGLDNPYLTMTIDAITNPEKQTPSEQLQVSAFGAAYESVLKAQGVDPVEFSNTYADLAQTAQEIGIDTSIHQAACNAYYAEAVGKAVSEVGSALGDVSGQTVRTFTPE